jgi:hypothetical protein
VIKPLDLLSGTGGVMNSYPANEQWISEVERGRSCRATLPFPSDKRLAPGDTILFALASSRPGEEAQYVKGGDSVLVSLIDVVDLGTVDRNTGEPLFQISWRPLGQSEPPAATSRRAPKPRIPTQQD